MNRQEMIDLIHEFLSDHTDLIMVHSISVVMADKIIAAQGDDTAEFRVRKNAPDTSKAIVDKVRGGTLQGRMLTLFKNRYYNPRLGYTDDELESTMERTHQSVSATRNTLMRKGYVTDGGMRRKTRSGNDAIVYVWTGKETP